MDSMNTTALAKFGDYTPDPRLREEGKDKPWLEQLKIAHGISSMVMDRKAQVGDFTLGEDVVSEDGAIKIVIGPSRPNAIWMDPDNNWKPKAQSHDLDSDEYAQIKAAEANKQKGAKTGAEFLVYLVERGVFATFHLTGMAKNETPSAYDALDKSKGAKVVSLSTKPVGKKKVPVPTFKVTDEDAPAVSEAKFQHAMTLFTAYQHQTEDTSTGAGERPR